MRRCKCRIGEYARRSGEMGRNHMRKGTWPK
jgi:hypothetical protein